jgi:hypothetical protein
LRLQFGSGADLSVAGMDELVSGVIRKSDSFGSNRGRWKAGEASSGDAKASFGWRSVPRNRATAASMIFDYFTGTGKRNNTVSRARHPGGDNLSKNLFN